MQKQSKKWDTDNISRKSFLGLLLPLILIIMEAVHLPFFKKRKMIRIKDGKHLAG